MSQIKPLKLRMMVFSSLFTALIIIGGYFSFPVPFSPVPVVLADLFVMLAGLLLKAAWGGAAVGMFLFIGALGLPVFAGGKAGLAALFGPTGGFLFGYLGMVLVIGLVFAKGKPSFIKDLIALSAGNLVLFSMGIWGLKLALKINWDKALVWGLLPYIPGNLIKIIAALAMVQALRPLLNDINKQSQSVAQPE